LIRIRLANANKVPEWHAVGEPELSRKVEGFVLDIGYPRSTLFRQALRCGGGADHQGIPVHQTAQSYAFDLRIDLLAFLVWSVNATRSARRQAKIATSRELLAASMANLSIDPERSILLALAAVALARRLGEEGDEIMSISWSPDGRKLVTGTWCDTCAGSEHHSAVGVGCRRRQDYAAQGPCR
jgi:hypothetical protein